MTINPDIYVDMKGRQRDLSLLDSEERQLVGKLQKRVRTHPDWNDFDNFWMAKVAALYDGRGLSRKESMQAAAYQIGQDLSGRLAISLGLAREPDYRDDLREIIRTRFKSQRKFCKAAGISEDMLSHVLAGRKDLSMQSLTKALNRIGYSVQFVPCKASKPKSKSA